MASTGTLVGLTSIVYLTWANVFSNVRFHQIWSMLLFLFTLLADGIWRSPSGETGWLMFLLMIVGTFCLVLSPVPALFQKTRSYRSQALEIPYSGKDEEDVSIDIIAVHGLANADTGWNSQRTKDRQTNVARSSDPHMWLRDFLPKDIPDSRIMIFNHNTAWRADALNKSLKDHGNDLLRALLRNRKEHSRPIVFIGHSFGGLIIKQAIINANEDRGRELHEGIINNTKGFIFLGVPHRGSKLTFLGELASVIGYWRGSRTNLLEVLRPGSTINEALHEGFLRILNYGCKKDVVCVFESVSERFLGYPITQVVNKESAVIDAAIQIGHDKQHRLLQRFSSRDDEQYGDVIYWLKEWAGATRQAAQTAIDNRLQDITHEQERAFRSLYFDEMYRRRLEVTEEAIDTCSWILGHSKYVSWKQHDKGLLWIKGKPGAGKSTIMNFIVKHHQQTSKGVMAYHFISGRGTKMQKSCLGTYQSLLHQIVSQRPDLSSNLVRTFESKCKLQGKHEKKWTWHEKEVKDILRDTVFQVPSGSYIELFIDALDESGHIEARTLLEYFQDLAETAVGRVKVCVSSRHYPFASVGHNLEIIVERHNADDITTYVKSKLRGSIGSRDKLEEVKKEIIARSSNVFQWVFLVLPRVLDLCRYDSTLKALLQAIRAFPTELGQLYQDLLSDVKGKERVLLQRLMCWVCFSTRPLTLVELRYAMVIDSVTGPMSAYALETSVDFKECNRGMMVWVTNLSRGLLEARKDSTKAENSARSESLARSQILTIDPVEDDQSETFHDAPEDQLASWVVQPNHQSVQDFIQDRNLFELEEIYNDTVGAANWSLLRSCLRYLAAEEVVHFFSEEDSYRDRWFECKNRFLTLYPFFDYAVENWPAHAIKVKASKSGEILTELIGLSEWPFDRILTTLSGPHKRNGQIPQTSPLLHLAAYHGFFHIVDTILRDPSSPDPDSRGPGGSTPLMYAVHMGHQNVVQLLLRTGRVDANSVTGVYTPLICAAEGKDEAMMNLLLQDGEVNPDGRNCYGQTALSCATIKCLKEAVALLLNTGRVDVNTRDKRGATPLHWTPFAYTYADPGNQSLEIAKLLLENGAKTDIKDESGRVALHEAGRSDQSDIARLILDNGGDSTVETKDKDGQTPLSLAASQGKSMMVRTLLEFGATTDARNLSGCTPLMMAASLSAVFTFSDARGHQESCRLLLQHGANVNAQCDHGRTAIYFVIGHAPSMFRRGWSRPKVSIMIFELLIAAGADVNHRDSFGRTVLSYARESKLMCEKRKSDKYEQIIDFLEYHGCQDHGQMGRGVPELREYSDDASSEGDERRNYSTRADFGSDPSTDEEEEEEEKEEYDDVHDDTVDADEDMIEGVIEGQQEDGE